MPMGNNAPVAALEALLGAVEFVTLHVPLSDATTNMIGPEQIARMRKGRWGCCFQSCVWQTPPLSWAPLSAPLVAQHAVEVDSDELALGELPSEGSQPVQQAQTADSACSLRTHPAGASWKRACMMSQGYVSLGGK